MGEFTFAFRRGEYEGQTGLVVAYAIRHAAGTFLFDTGFGFGDAGARQLLPAVRRPADFLPEVASKAGLDLAEITAVANCHLHP